MCVECTKNLNPPQHYLLSKPPLQTIFKFFSKLFMQFHLFHSLKDLQLHPHSRIQLTTFFLISFNLTQITLDIVLKSRVENCFSFGWMMVVMMLKRKWILIFFWFYSPQFQYRKAQRKNKIASKSRILRIKALKK